MPPSRAKILVEKSLDACLSAIEIYNKPNFRYRGEVFSILMLNAWELLLKARVLQENHGNLRSIEVWEPTRKKDGSKGKRKQRKTNRSGNTMTIGAERAVELVRNYTDNGIDQRCVKNIYLLQQIRDNAVHLHNVSAGLGKRIQEIGSASLKNFVFAIGRWFGVDVGRYNFYLMPLTFHSPTEIVESLDRSHHSESVRKLLNHIAEAERENPSDENANFHVTIEIQLKFIRTSNHEATPVKIAHNDSNAVAVTISEEDMRRQFPWSYRELTQRLKSRYIDFLQNKKYHAIRKALENEGKFCRIRYLDPSKTRGVSKKFYNSGILTKFDRQYIRR